MTESNYKAPLFLRNGHLNTLWTHLFRNRPQLSFSRERFRTSDNDFIHLDFLRDKGKKIAILCHGLEGSSQSQYIQGSAHELLKAGFDICAMNYRFCSGEINNTPQLYHSGYTQDLKEVIDSLKQKYLSIYLIGFSLGGNVVLKFAGDGQFKLPSNLNAIVAISTPLDLEASSQQLLKFENSIYSIRFLRSLKKKIRKKAEQFPDEFNLEKLKKTRTIWDFDDFYTGPLNGFKDAHDYYNKCNAKQFLSTITIPTLIINSKDDPFLKNPNCYPSDSDINNEKIQFLYPKYGGHCGFFQNRSSIWSEKFIAKWLLSKNG